MTKMSQRIASAAVALLLQAGFLLLLLQAVELSPVRKELSREVTLTFLRLPTVRRPPTAPALPGIPSLIRPQAVPPALPSPLAIPLVPPGAIRGFGQALNGCAPENYENLSPDQKAHCIRPGAGVAVQQAPNLMGSPSHVKDEARWREEWAREQSPALLPCGGFVNVACLLGKIADGSLSDFGDPTLWPRYAVKQIPPEDFYKIEQTYKDWHAAHAAPKP